jgi:FAD/FMN-containing dehydrogenase
MAEAAGDPPSGAIAVATVQAFREGLRGELLLPEDAGYDAARKVWNGRIDRRPALIARCTGVDDVIRAVNFARDHRLLVAVRGGGHNVAGNGVCDGGIVIDVSPMKQIQVDPVARTARAGAGLTWGEFDQATQAHGLAVTGGHVSSTGIAGLTLGGGIGWLMRKHGLTCDNLLSAEVVTAEGRCVTAGATENPDLFWGLRGGGGNFGVVTSFTYQLHPISTVLAGMLFYPASQARALLRFYRDYVTTIPHALTSFMGFVTAPSAPFLPQHLHGTPMFVFVGCYAGEIEAGEAALRPLREFATPAVDLIRPVPYTSLQTMLDPSAPHGLQNYWKSGDLDRLSDEVIDILVAGAATVPSPLSLIAVMHLGGAVSRVAEGETAVSRRHVPFMVNLLSAWPDPADSAGNLQWTRKLWARLQPLTQSGVYVNFLGDEGEERVRAAYGATIYDRLVKLKNRYDPHNLFRVNQNIRPTAG